MADMPLLAVKLLISIILDTRIRVRSIISQFEFDKLLAHTCFWVLGDVRTAWGGEFLYLNAILPAQSALLFGLCS